MLSVNMNPKLYLLIFSAAICGMLPLACFILAWEVLSIGVLKFANNKCYSLRVSSVG